MLAGKAFQLLFQRVSLLIVQRFGGNHFRVDHVAVLSPQVHILFVDERDLGLSALLDDDPNELHGEGSDSVRKEPFRDLGFLFARHMWAENEVLELALAGAEIRYCVQVGLNGGDHIALLRLVKKRLRISLRNSVVLHLGGRLHRIDEVFNQLAVPLAVHVLAQDLLGRGKGQVNHFEPELSDNLLLFVFDLVLSSPN